LTALCTIHCARLLTRRSRFDPAGRALIDLIIGFNAMYFLAALFEGHMIARISPFVVFMLLFSTIASRLITIADHAVLLDSAGAPSLDDEDLSTAQEDELLTHCAPS
jgi:hypothetical protein